MTPPPAFNQPSQMPTSMGLLPKLVVYRFVQLAVCSCTVGLSTLSIVRTSSYEIAHNQQLQYRALSNASQTLLQAHHQHSLISPVALANAISDNSSNNGSDLGSGNSLYTISVLTYGLFVFMYIFITMLIIKPTAVSVRLLALNLCSVLTLLSVRHALLGWWAPDECQNGVSSLSSSILSSSSYSFLSSSPSLLSPSTSCNLHGSTFSISVLAAGILLSSLIWVFASSFGVLKYKAHHHHHHPKYQKYQQEKYEKENQYYSQKDKFGYFQELESS